MTNQKDIIAELIAKTYTELNAPKQPIQKSRTWEHPEAYKYLVQWSNSVLLRYFIRLFTASLPKSEYRRKTQLDDAARSVVRNIEEGWKRANTSDYLSFIGYSQGSLEEVKGDIRELTEDHFLPSKPGSSLKDLEIDLGTFNKALSPRGGLEESTGNYISLNSYKNPVTPFKGDLKENKGDYNKPAPESDSIFLYRPITLLYPPLKEIQAKDLTYEIFIELINKTDFLLRKLVESLEQKLQNDRLGYQISKALIEEKFK